MALGQHMKRVPVTLVTGFLGAGKTTLLNHVLEAETGRRFAVIENEFGDVGVDGSLVAKACETLFELNDGCVCCSVLDSLAKFALRIIVRLTRCVCSVPSGCFQHVDQISFASHVSRAARVSFASRAARLVYFVVLA